MTRQSIIIVALAFLGCYGSIASAKDAGVRNVVLSSGTSTPVHLTIPNILLFGPPSDNWLELRIVYPSMAGCTRLNFDVCYSANGSWGDGMLRIRIGMHELEAPEYFPYKNRNDPGRFWYENNVVAGTHYVKSENAEPEPIAENITPYSFDSVKPQNHQRTYLLDLGSRMAKCRCIYSTLCTCETTWKGILAIEFDVSRKLFSEILNIEEDVVEMVNTFARRTNSEKNDS